MDDSPLVIPNAWQTLRHLTPARIALGRCGVSQPTAVQLAFQQDHAAARDAVHFALDAPALAATLKQSGYDYQLAHSACPNRATYTLTLPSLSMPISRASMSGRVSCAPPWERSARRSGAWCGAWCGACARMPPTGPATR